MKIKFYSFMAVAASFVLLASCSSKKKSVAKDVLNGGFENCENGAITNWTKTGTAFSARGIVSSEEVNGTKVEKVGEYFFSGLDGGTQQMTGTLTSKPFKLTGTGKIAFKMGAGKNAEKVYVEFLVKNQVVLKVSNTDYNEPYCTVQMVRKIADLSKYIGKEVTIRVTDNDNTDDFGYVNLDDFVVCKTEEELRKYEDERARELELYSEPPFEEDETSTTIQNPGFETGDLTGWKVVSGTAFTKSNVCPTSQYYWNDRSVYGEGEYYLDGSNNGETPESAVGVIRSTKFTLDGDGYISFMIGAAPTNCYVALCSAVDDSELIKVTNNGFNDPKLPLTLLRTYVDASNYKGQVVYLKVVDNNPSSGFAFMNVDDFRVSLTEDEVKELQLEQFNKIKAETYTDSYDSLKNLMNYYEKYEYLFPIETLIVTHEAPSVSMALTSSFDLNTLLEDVVISYGDTEVTPAITKVVYGEDEFTSGFDQFDLSNKGTYVIYYGATYDDLSVEKSFTLVIKSTNNITNGDFEAGTMAGWTLISGENISENPVAQGESFWGEEISFNQGGNYHFDGWTACGVESEGYAFRSEKFTLAGTGMISFKLGGNAARLKVYLEDGTKICEFENPNFADVAFPSLANGCRLATMTTYYYDLSAYKDSEIYVVIEDAVINGGWAVAFFDDINFYYETEEDFASKVDTVLESKLPDVEEREEVSLPWTLAVNKVQKDDATDSEVE